MAKRRRTTTRTVYKTRTRRRAKKAMRLSIPILGALALGYFGVAGNFRQYIPALPGLGLIFYQPMVTLYSGAYLLGESLRGLVGGGGFTFAGYQVNGALG